MSTDKTDPGDKDAATRAVVIAGMHRSGTSMVAKALSSAGLYLGPESELIPPAPDNPSGFFEHEAFVRLNDDLLAATGGAWDHPPPAAPMAADDSRVVLLAERARELVEELAIVPRWGWKDPRVSLTIRFWLDVVPELWVIVCVRHPLEVALSLKRRNNTSYAHGLSLWHSYYETVLDAAPAERLLVTHYDAHFRDRASEAARLLEFAGLPDVGLAEAQAALEQELRHHTIDVGLAEAGVDPATVELYGRLRELAGDPAKPVPPGSEPGPARVERTAADIALLKKTLAERSRQIATVTDERDVLRERTSALERLGRDDVLDAITRRLDRLEDGIHEQRYAAEAQRTRPDAEELARSRQLVREHVPRECSVLVVTKSDPDWLDLFGRPTENFPQDATGRYPGFSFAHSIGAIAHLEALRARGADYILVPAPSSWWLDTFPEFAAHLVGRYEPVAADEGGGFLIDLRAPVAGRDAGGRSLSEVIDRVAARVGGQPAVLDCTGTDLVTQLPDRKAFAPPEGEGLPYRDRTVDVVLVPAEPGEKIIEYGWVEEARRVATIAVVTVEDGGAPVVAAVEELAPADGDTPRQIFFVPLNARADRAWVKRLEEALAGEAGTSVAAGLDTLPEAEAEGEGRIVALIEEGVLPLPGCCDAVRATFEGSESTGAVVAKLLTAGGAIEAAGTVVFADGSFTGVAEGSHKLLAPWHEFVRDACGGAGITFFTDQGLEALPSSTVSPPGPLTAAAGHVWAAGRRVVYQPDAAVVRTTAAPESGAAAVVRIAEAWEPALRARPPRPVRLTSAAADWRQLLARDEVAASWRAAAAPA
jgi:hypothetical protein